MSLSLDDHVEKVPLVGPLKATLLRNLNIFTVDDLLHHYPFRYDDYRQILKISQLLFGQTATVFGTIEKIDNIFTRGGRRLTKARLADETGAIEIVWFNQPFLAKTLKPGTSLAVSGRVEQSAGKLSFISPDYEIHRSELTTFNSQLLTNIHTACLVPIYPETVGISSKWLRSRINFLLTNQTELGEIFPIELLESENLIGLTESINKIHFPQNPQEILEAKKRLSFDEVFLLQLRSKLNREKWEKHLSKFQFSIVKSQLKVDQFIKSLPFELTGDQQKAATEILNDLSGTKPMNRLLQGDVGSGKTAVAALAAYATVLSGYKVFLMCPTEILAVQHFQTFQKLFHNYETEIELVTSSNRQNKSQISNLKSQIFVGTHALLYGLEKTTDIGLIVIDEQHKFGVGQRTKLLEMFKTGNKVPHLLSMTATPIPRTLALTSLGDLDISYIQELPKGRQPIKTWVVPQAKRDPAYKWIKDEVKNNDDQVYIVCPFIEESEIETLKSVRAAKKEVESLQKTFSPFKVELLHGKLKSSEKDAVMENFTAGQTKILVATPVVEVGLDNPQAIIILIEGAERFGLASLHQLRGRVGRSNKQSYCLLFTSSDETKNLARLKLLEKTNSGLKLAEFDLKNRGVGQIYGKEQSGFLKTKIADLNDLEYVSHINKLSQQFVETGDLEKFPLLLEKIEDANKVHLD